MNFRRIANSTVVWSWVFTALRLAKGLVILPLVMHQFSTAEVGMYMVLLNLAGLAVVVDFGFGPTIGRFISYAMGGARDLASHGVPKAGSVEGPNYPLMWNLLATTRRLYGYLALALLVILGVGGTLYVEYLLRREQLVSPEFSPFIPRLAWLTTLLSTVLDIYSNWWAIYLRGLNEVRKAAQIGTVAMAVNFVISVALLLGGAGLLSLPLAAMASNLVQRRYNRLACLKLLPPKPPVQDVELRKHFALLWPSSWRLGVQLISGSLVTQLSLLLCAKWFHLDAAAKYGPSVMLMGIASSMAYVWVATKWPEISQYRARHELGAIQRVLWARVWLQMGTFVLLAGAVVLIAPDFLHWVGKDKELLPTPWLLVLALAGFLDSQFNVWGTLISTENRLPYLWPTVATNVAGLGLALALVRWTDFGVGALVLGPLLAGALFNYWFWPLEGARGIGTTLVRFLFLGPKPTEPPVAQ